MQCRECQQPFSSAAPDLALLKRLSAPPPTRCSRCRLQRRLAFWPFGRFYQRPDSLTGKPLVSVLSDQARFPVTDRNNWYSDSWEAPKLSVNFDRPFFEQFKELQERTPHFHMLGDDKNVNCDYADDVWSSKDCFHCRSMYKTENSHYMYRVVECRDCLDCTYSFKLENCYENTYCFNNYATRFALDSRNCLDAWFLYDCRGLKNCFMCWNLRNKEYCIRNQSYTPAGYQAELAKLNLRSWKTLQGLREEWRGHLQTDAVHRARHITNSENCVGNYLDQCSNVTDTFFTERAENCHHLLRNYEAKDCLDCTGLLTGELCYETAQSSQVYNVRYASLSIRCRDSEYLDECVDLADCFGCVGLKKKRFCIFNKQYTQEDYQRVVEKLKQQMSVKGEYGEFLPYSMMYTGYNNSFAQFYFPLEANSAAVRGIPWEETKTAPASATTADSAPDKVNDYQAVVGKVLICERTGRPYKLIEQELKFYQQHGVPIPRLHPDERNLERYRQLAGITPRQIECFNCRKPVTTYYAAEFGYQKILCQRCYEGGVY